MSSEFFKSEFNRKDKNQHIETEGRGGWYNLLSEQITSFQELLYKIY